MSNENSASEVRTSQNEPERGQRIFTFKASQWIWLLLYVVEILIALRIMFQLMGANPGNQIVALTYGLTSFLLTPFAGLIGSITIAGKVLEISSLFAIGVYALIAVVFERLVWLIFYRPRNPMVDITETTTSKHHTAP